MITSVSGWAYEFIDAIATDHGIDLRYLESKTDFPYPIRDYIEYEMANSSLCVGDVRDEVMRHLGLSLEESRKVNVEYE